MKKLSTLVFSLSFTFFPAKKVELKKVTDSSQVFKEEIAGPVVTIQHRYAEIMNCKEKHKSKLLKEQITSL